LQFGVLERVGLTIQGRRDEDFRRHRFAVEVANDRPQGLASDAVGVLDRVGVDLAVLDGALPFRLAVEGDDLDLVRLVGLFQRRPRAEGGRVVDGEDARETEACTAWTGRPSARSTSRSSIASALGRSCRT
jgi:hypothetical protein